MALRGKFQRPQNRPATIEYTEKGLSKLCCKTQRNLESPLFQAFFSTYVPEKAFSVCIKDSVFIDSACGSGGMFVSSSDFVNAEGINANSVMTFYGQEKVEFNAKLCIMNMVVHGLNAKIKSGDEANSFYHDAHNKVWFHIVII